MKILTSVPYPQKMSSVGHLPDMLLCRFPTKGLPFLLYRTLLLLSRGRLRPFELILPISFLGQGANIGFTIVVIIIIIPTIINKLRK